jgi:hypothetical protein
LPKRQHVPSDRRLLLEVALRRTSTLSVLLDEVSEAALGVSLKVADRALYDRIRSLTKQRNSIVHEGHSRTTPIIAGGPALVASDLFAWLVKCVPPPSS